MPEITPVQPQKDTAILLHEVSVRYRIPSDAIRTFKEYMIRLMQGRIKYTPYLALNKINLEVKQGEIFGILGRNGAGKTTLLKAISKVLIPGEGRVWTRGFVSPLLQLGAGFHPELTGFENIFLNATLLGHPQNEVEGKLEEIISFSDIRNFLDAPLRTYSSGMQARLGFAIATAWHPDILILDEVLSVGDVAFQKKCIKRMAQYRDSGATVLMVSHTIDQVRNNCQRAIWLEKGEIQLMGSADEVCNEYQKAMELNNH